MIERGVLDFVGFFLGARKGIKKSVSLLLFTLWEWMYAFCLLKDLEGLWDVSPGFLSRSANLKLPTFH